MYLFMADDDHANAELCLYACMGVALAFASEADCTR